MTELLRRYLGPNWLKKPADQSTWKRVDDIPDVELWRVHERRRERLVAFARKRLAQQLKRRGAGAKEIDSAREVLNPEALTIGFARRFATYKRATLLLRDPSRLRRLLTRKDQPVQFIFAGKAHPRDNGGKDLIKQLIHFARADEVRNHLVFLENYDINVARYLVEGVDVWMNNPRRPLEASGTSGMKVIPNGGLNLSVLDGWWCEGYDTDTGWAIGAGEDYRDPEYQDEVESKHLYDVLENEIIPLFYDRKGDSPPRGWINMMRSSMRKLGPQFSTNRMVRQYTEDFYMTAYDNWGRLSADNFDLARNLVQWRRRIEAGWSQVDICEAQVEERPAEVGMALQADAAVRLGNLKPEDVCVELYFGALDTEQNITDGQVEMMQCTGEIEPGLYRYQGWIGCDESGLFGYSVRVMPNNPDLADHFGLQLMRWIGESRRRSEAPDSRTLAPARA
jgi:starch phosphorylase